MGGWLGSRVRLIESAGDCPERARIELTRAVVTDDPGGAGRHLAAAVEIAQRVGRHRRRLRRDEPARSEPGRGRRGRGRDGAARRGAGRGRRPERCATCRVGAMYCKMLHACELTNDVRRAEDWLEGADGSSRGPTGADQRDLPHPLRRRADRRRAVGRGGAGAGHRGRALRPQLPGAAGGGHSPAGRAAGPAGQARGGRAAARRQRARRYAIRPLVELDLARGEPDLAVARVERFFRGGPRSRDRRAGSAPAGARPARPGGRRRGRRGGSQLRERRPAAVPALWPRLAEHAAGLVAAATDRGGDGTWRRRLPHSARCGLPLEQARARLELAGVLADSGRRWRWSRRGRRWPGSRR